MGGEVLQSTGHTIHWNVYMNGVIVITITICSVVIGTREEGERSRGVEEEGTKEGGVSSEMVQEGRARFHTRYIFLWYRI